MVHQELLKFMLDRQLPSGAFPHQAGRPDLDVLASAQLVSLLYYMDISDSYQDKINHAVEFLLSSQHENGKWSGGENSWETGISAWVLCALTKSGKLVTDPAVSNGWLWLLDREKENGAFVQSEKVFRVNLYAHAYAIRALAMIENSYQDIKQRAIQFLIDNQNSDGGYGLYPGEPSSVQMTCYVLHGISRYTQMFEQPLGRSAFRFILQHQNRDGSWGSYVEKNVLESTAFALFALKLGQISTPETERGYDFIDYFMRNDRWDLLPFTHLISMVQSYFVRH